MKYKLTILVDDDDRAQAPDAPWTAILLSDATPFEAGGGGIGGTPLEAVQVLVSEFLVVEEG